MNTDTLTTLAGAGTATAVLSQINFATPGWWKQAVVAAGILALGYYTNKAKKAQESGQAVKSGPTQNP